MSDMPHPELERIRSHLLRPTLCSIDNHAWQYTSVISVEQPDPWLKCDCGMYTWEQAAQINDRVIPTDEKLSIVERAAPNEISTDSG